MDDNKETYSVEIEDNNFFSKFIKKLTKHKNQKLLTSGNVKVKYTSESISSMWRKTAIKAAIIKRVESFTNLFIKTKEPQKNTLDTLLVKDDEYVKKEEVTNEVPADQKIIEETTLSDVAPIIPKAVSKTIKYNSKVGNTEDAKDDN